MMDGRKIFKTKNKKQKQNRSEINNTPSKCCENVQVCVTKVTLNLEGASELRMKKLERENPKGSLDGMFSTGYQDESCFQ